MFYKHRNTLFSFAMLTCLLYLGTEQISKQESATTHDSHMEIRMKSRGNSNEHDRQTKYEPHVIRFHEQDQNPMHYDPQDQNDAIRAILILPMHFTPVADAPARSEPDATCDSHAIADATRKMPYVRFACGISVDWLVFHAIRMMEFDSHTALLPMRFAPLAHQNPW
ncbi:hypothetical protein Plhal304r1_c031g0100101 [Plasmopara halstedii]